MTATGDQLVPREERVLLAVRAYQQGQFESTRKAAAAYDVLNRQYLIDCAVSFADATLRQSTLADTIINAPNAKTPKIQGWYDRVAATKQKWGFLTRMSITLMRRGFKWESPQRRDLEIANGLL
ncbi:hypothetical protein HRG_014517 [Hirsutella rhossiliensis]